MRADENKQPDCIFPPRKNANISSESVVLSAVLYYNKYCITLCARHGLSEVLF